jgi:hypothetical protein
MHKEIITAEKLSDGSTKTTRIVNTTPAGGDSQQSKIETNVNSTSSDIKDAKSEMYKWKCDGHHKNVKRMAPQDKTLDTLRSEEKAKNGQNNWAWWFWSRK